MNFTAFFSYVILSAFTPGPNNIMSMSNAGKYGFKGGFRFNIGVFLGFLLVLSACAAFSALLFNYIPKIEPVMVFIGAGYILWLAWSIWRDKPHEEKKGLLQTNSIFTGLVMQFINVKVILYGITTMSTFILPNYKSLPVIIAFILLLSLTGFIATCLWALFGAVFERIFREHKKALNLIMALLLVYTAYTLVFH